jgi:hypothetical protein
MLIVKFNKTVFYLEKSEMRITSLTDSLPNSVTPKNKKDFLNP